MSAPSVMANDGSQNTEVRATQTAARVHVWARWDLLFGQLRNGR